ncbi:MAG: putative beta-lysine N-acetyltransferase [Lentisphaeria bacterium]
MPDAIINIGKSQIQHGPANDRVYLMKLDEGATKKTLDEIDRLAESRGYSKIFAKVPSPGREQFLTRGYAEEARIPQYYNGRIDLHFMSRFLTSKRAIAPDQAEQKEALALARGKQINDKPATAELPPSYSYRVCEEKDAPAIVKVYKKVFESYPFPIHDPDYIVETMRTNVTYFGIWAGGQLIALSSAERDLAADSVEMTDFATLPPARRRGLGVFLLQHMEEEMARRGVYTAYTIARAISAGMNIVFAKQGYKYGGTLVNNTDICGRLESMNIWWKALQ